MDKRIRGKAVFQSFLRPAAREKVHSIVAGILLSHLIIIKDFFLLSGFQCYSLSTCAVSERCWYFFK